MTLASSTDQSENAGRYEALSESAVDFVTRKGGSVHEDMLVLHVFGKSASLVVDDVEKYEPYLMGVLLGLIGCAWLGHFAHGWMRKRKAIARLRRMQARRER